MTRPTALALTAILAMGAMTFPAVAFAGSPRADARAPARVDRAGQIKSRLNERGFRHYQEFANPDGYVTLGTVYKTIFDAHPQHSRVVAGWSAMVTMLTRDTSNPSLASRAEVLEDPRLALTNLRTLSRRPFGKIDILEAPLAQPGASDGFTLEQRAEDAAKARLVEGGSTDGRFTEANLDTMLKKNAKVFGHRLAWKAAWAFLNIAKETGPDGVRFISQKTLTQLYNGTFFRLAAKRNALRPDPHFQTEEWLKTGPPLLARMLVKFEAPKIREAFKPELRGD